MFGHVEKKKNELIRRIRGVQQAISRCPNKHFIKVEKMLINEFQNVLKQEEEIWRLKSSLLGCGGE